MDNLTHTLVGVLLARTLLGRLAPRATLMCVVAANIPDIDIVTSSSSIDYLNYHRHITHSIPAVPVMAALAVALVEGPRRWLRKGADPPPWLRTWLLAMIAALTHPLLDLCNPYGVRAWLPFSERWYQWDVLFIVDFWIWATLLFATLAPAVIALVHREIGAATHRGGGPALIALFALAAYISVKAVFHQQALGAIDAHLYDGAPAVRVAAFPRSLKLLGWSTFVETEGYYQISSIDFLDSAPFDPTAGRRYYKPRPGPALESAWNSETGRDYARFAQFAYTQIDSDPEGSVVRLTDFRFRTDSSAGFLCKITLDNGHRVVGEYLGFSGRE